MSYCHCGNRFSFENATKELADISGQATLSWRCGRCGNISHAVQEERAVVRGPANATAILSADGRTSGIHTVRWATPDGVTETIEYFPYPRKVHMSNPEPKLFQLWELLQRKVEFIMDDTLDPLTVAEAKWQGRGIAEALAILMEPFVEDADAVVRHAVAYYKDNSYEVPGLGLHLWNSLYDADGNLRQPVAAPTRTKPRATVKAPPRRKAALSDADIAFAKQGLDAGMFSIDDLASMFKTSPEEVKAAVS